MVHLVLYCQKELIGALFGGSKPTPVAASPMQQGPSQEELLKTGIHSN